MKRKQSGFIEVTMVVMLLVYAGIVGQHISKGEKAPETPATTNYNK